MLALVALESMSFSLASQAGFISQPPASTAPTPPPLPCENLALENLYKNFEELRRWPVIAEIAWQEATIEKIAQAFPLEGSGYENWLFEDPVRHLSERLPIGESSFLHIGVQQSGKFCILVTVVKTEPRLRISGILSAFSGSAANTVYGANSVFLDGQVESVGAVERIFFFGITDTSLTPDVPGAAPDGRFKFLAAIHSYLKTLTAQK